MKFKARVSYKPVYGQDGTVYRKIIRIPEKIYDSFRLAMAGRAGYTASHDEKYWIQKAMQVSGDMRFLNVTQGDFFCEWLARMDDVEVDIKRLAVVGNTALRLER